MDRSKFEAFFYFLGFEVSIDIIPGTDLLLVIIINFVAFLTFHKPNSKSQCHFTSQRQSPSSFYDTLVYLSLIK